MANKLNNTAINEFTVISCATLGPTLSELMIPYGLVWVVWNSDSVSFWVISGESDW